MKKRPEQICSGRIKPSAVPPEFPNRGTPAPGNGGETAGAYWAHTRRWGRDSGATSPAPHGTFHHPAPLLASANWVLLPFHSHTAEIIPKSTCNVNRRIQKQTEVAFRVRLCYDTHSTRHVPIRKRGACILKRSFRSVIVR